MSAPDVMGPAEVRERLGVSRNRAYRVTVRPDFPEPAVLVSGRRVWLTADVEAWMAKHWPEAPGDRS